jgi:hypothetical protein
VQGAQVDQDVDEGVLIGDSVTIAQPGTLNAEFFGLGVDALGGGALFVDALVDFALVADANLNAGG